MSIVKPSELVSDGDYVRAFFKKKGGAVHMNHFGSAGVLLELAVPGGTIGSISRDTEYEAYGASPCVKSSGSSGSAPKRR